MYCVLITYFIVDTFSVSKKYYNHNIFFLDDLDECEFLICQKKYELEKKYSNVNCLYIDNFKSEIQEVIKTKINYV